MTTEGKEDSQNMTNRTKMENLQRSQKTKLYTRHSMISAYDEETLNTHILKKQSDIFNSNMPSPNMQQHTSPFSKMKKLGIKTVISEDSNDNNLQNQRFFEQQRALRTYKSEEKLVQRKSRQRRKIFDDNYLQRLQNRRTLNSIAYGYDEEMEKNSTLELIQKIEKILPKMEAKFVQKSEDHSQLAIDQYFYQNEYNFQKQHITTKLQKQISTPYRIHSTPNTIVGFRKGPKSNQIIFDCHNHVKKINITKLDKQLENNRKIYYTNDIFIKKEENIMDHPFQSDNKNRQHANPVYFKVKNRFLNKPNHMNAHKAENIKNIGLLTNAIEASKDIHLQQNIKFNLQDINSKTKTNNFGKTSINVKVNHKQSLENDLQKINLYLDEQISSPSRYFDEDKQLLGKRISFRSIEIQGNTKNENENEEQCIMQRVHPNDLLVDFDCHSEEREKEYLRINSALKLDLNISQTILKNCATQAPYLKYNTFSLGKILPTLLILLSVLLLAIQLSR